MFLTGCDFLAWDLIVIDPLRHPPHSRPAGIFGMIGIAAFMDEHVRKRRRELRFHVLPSMCCGCLCDWMMGGPLQRSQVVITSVFQHSTRSLGAFWWIGSHLFRTSQFDVWPELVLAEGIG